MITIEKQPFSLAISIFDPYTDIPTLPLLRDSYPNCTTLGTSSYFANLHMAVAVPTMQLLFHVNGLAQLTPHK